MGRGGIKAKMTKQSLKALPKLLKYLFKYYKIQMIIVFICIICSAIAGAFNTVFLKRIIDDVITPGLNLGYAAVKGALMEILIMMVCVYGVGVLCGLLYTDYGEGRTGLSESFKKGYVCQNGIFADSLF